MNPLELQMLVLLSGVPEASGTVLTSDVNRPVEAGLFAASYTPGLAPAARVTGVSVPRPRVVKPR